MISNLSRTKNVGNYADFVDRFLFLTVSKRGKLIHVKQTLQLLVGVFL